MDEIPLYSWGFINPILPLSKANPHKLVKYCVEFLTIEDSLVCNVPSPKES